MDSPRTPLQTSTYFFDEPPTYELLLDQMVEKLKKVTKRQLTFDNMLLEIHELREELEKQHYIIKMLESQIPVPSLNDIDDEEGI